MLFTYVFVIVVPYKHLCSPYSGTTGFGQSSSSLRHFGISSGL